MILLRPEEMARVDKYTIDSGFPEILLMEAAGRGVSEMAAEKTKHGAKVVVVAGSGNNGGDGFVSARFLAMWGREVTVVLAGDPEGIEGVAKTNLELIKNRKVQILTFSDVREKEIKKVLVESDLIIDALLGTGLEGEVRGSYAKLIELINSTLPPVLAVDIPSGLDGKTGEVHGRTVKADLTATMAYMKIGLCVYPGRKYCGEISVVDIGMTNKALEPVNCDTFMLGEEEAATLLPGRSVTGHKGTFGRVTIVGGSRGLTGAPLLAGRAALRAGAGLVKLAVPEEIKSEVAGGTPELILTGLENTKEGIIRSIGPVFSYLQEESDAIVAGPGMGCSPEVTGIISKLIKECNTPLILDADGINAINNLNMFFSREAPLILTPHPGEMARMLGKEIKDIQNNRMELARNFAREYDIVLVLKGAATVVALPGGDLYVNPTGNEGMATAGSGDVLTGIIAALCGQGVEPEKAAVLGTYLHGLAGDLAVERVGSRGLIASDIIEGLIDAELYLESN
ncbi:MAG: NAD(P)H-hydrate dehydratase [Halanaerobiales bacterium]